MPRRNQRDGRHQPLDLTPDQVRLGKPDPFSPRKPHQLETWRDTQIRFQQRRMDELHQQEKARLKGGIDWSVCLIPGCDEQIQTWWGRPLPKELRDTDCRLPLCERHRMVVWREIQEERGNPTVIRAADDLDLLRQQKMLKEDLEHEERRRQELRDREGLIYFVKINATVKVGWTKDLPRRLKEYGAGADLLCHYPGSQADETALHRVLRPSLAKGREWYHDDALIKLHVKNAVDHHGPPTVQAYWTEPRKELAAQVRSRRR